MLMKKYDQRSRTLFLANYGGLSLYDIDTEKRYSIDDKDINFIKGDGYSLIGNLDHPYGSSTDHEYFCIHDNLFGRILENDQDSDTTLKVIHKETSLSSINVKRSNSISDKNIMSEMVTPCHQLQRKLQEKLHDYSQKSINDFILVLLNPYPKLTDLEKKHFMNYFYSSSKYKCIETNTKIILTHVLMLWKEDKSNAHPRTYALTAAETVALKIYSI